jgi:predicted protein tyrosine phosphatase
MEWKYCLPIPWTDPASRVALEDVYLIPPAGSIHLIPEWFTLEGLHSFTGGTREEKLDRLGPADYIIDDAMDMLVRQEDFDKYELLEWTRLFIKMQSGDPNPVLVEASPAECAERLSGTSVDQRGRARIGPMKLLFVHARGDPSRSFPEQVLNGDPRVAFRTVSLGDEELSAPEEEVISWADVIVVMEKRMRHIIRRRFKPAGRTKRVVCLHLPEQYDMQDPTYLRLFRERIEVYLAKLSLEGVP